MMASFLPISGCNGKLEEKLPKVGLHTFVAPSNFSMTLANVPFPDRLGPTSRGIV